MAEKMLVVAAHIGDYVWRCGGAIAKYLSEGNEVKVIILSDGIRGEANDYWRKEGANLEEGKKLRREEGLKAAAALGVTDFEVLDLDDYPLEVGREHIELLAHKIREFRPDFIVTHDTYDAYNQDHSVVNSVVRKAYATASGAGFRDGLPTPPRQIPIFGFEPHITEVSNFLPGVYVDITDVFEIKCNAMKLFSSQPSMYAQYVRKAEARAAEVRTRGSRKDCKYAEAFSTFQAATSTGKFIW